jgi:hypothetical protein
MVCPRGLRRRLPSQATVSPLEFIHRPVGNGKIRRRISTTSVAIKFDQPLVADPEVMRDLVEHDACLTSRRRRAASLAASRVIGAPKGDRGFVIGDHKQKRKSRCNASKDLSGLLHDQVTVVVTRPDWPVWS